MWFPKLVRKLSAEKIWEKFFEDLKNENPDVEGAIRTGQTTVAEQQRRKRERIGRSLFLRIVRKLTYGQDH